MTDNRPDDLIGVSMVHVPTCSVARIEQRKQDNSGWWLAEGGGLADEAIASGDWVPLAAVVAAYRGGFCDR